MNLHENFTIAEGLPPVDMMTLILAFKELVEMDLSKSMGDPINEAYYDRLLNVSAIMLIAVANSEEMKPYIKTADEEVNKEISDFLNQFT